jgi:basic amino acid/polyamine antiporter, APA family
MSTSVGLSKGIDIVDVVALGVGASIGVSIFSVMAPAARVAGTGMIAALAIAAVPMAIFTLVYAFMGSVVPRSGASYDWPARFIHPFCGFAVAWLRILGNLASLIVLSLVFVSYVRTAVPVPEKPTMFVLLLVFYLANLFGVRIATRLERVLVVAKCVAILIFIVAGISTIQLARLAGPTVDGWHGILAAVPLLVSLYLGIESATEVGEEILNGRAVIARGLSIAVVLSLAIYLCVSAIVLGILGAPALASSNAPLIDAGSHFLGAWNKPLIILTAAAAICTSFNALLMTFTRFLFAMGRDGVLPGALGKVHPRWRTPHVAITVVFVGSTFCLFLPFDLIFLFMLTNLPTMLKYFSNCWSALRLVRRHPHLHAQAKFRLSTTGVTVLAGSGMLLALAILALGVDADWRASAILAVWGAVGLAVWFSFARGGRASLKGQG